MCFSDVQKFSYKILYVFQPEDEGSRFLQSAGNHLARHHIPKDSNLLTAVTASNFAKLGHSTSKFEWCFQCTGYGFVSGLWVVREKYAQKKQGSGCS